MSRPYVKPYREGTPLSHIIFDGWCRGFHILQTYSECHAMGYSVDIECIQEAWDLEDEREVLRNSDDPVDKALLRASYFGLVI